MAHCRARVHVKTVNDDGRFHSWLARIDPGAVVPAHQHNGGEEILLLEGSCVVGGVPMQAGDYQFSPSGTRHEAMTTHTGCLLFLRTRSLGEPVGTIWVLAHDDERHFDAEDARLLEALAQFASAAYVLRSSQIAALEARDELVRANERLRRTNGRLWNKLSEVRPVEAEESQSA